MAAARPSGWPVNPRKCELVACGGDQAAVDLNVFPPHLPYNTTGSFALLGAPIGLAAFCITPLLTGSTRLGTFLRPWQPFHDAQAILLLLRQCASFCKAAYITRVTPTPAVAEALFAFDAAARKCLETTCIAPLTHRALLQAGLATASGGLGLRHAALHGAAAYAASVAATADLCLALDANYIHPLDEAFRAVNEVVCALTPSLSLHLPTFCSSSCLRRWTEQLPRSQPAFQGPGSHAAAAGFV